MNDTPSGSADLLAGLAALAAADALTVGADGFNPHFQYAYMTEEALFRAARAALSEVGLSGTISFDAGQHEQVVRVREKDSKEVTQTLATVTAVLTLRDKQGQQVECRAIGQGLDPADKAYAKAMTMAAKYAVQKGLMIGVMHNDDTDAGGGGAKRSTGSRGGGAGAAASAGQLGFVCSLVRKVHLVESGTDNAAVEALALRLARMRGDVAESFPTISKTIASDLIERLQPLTSDDGPGVLARLVEWETENGVAVPVERGPASSEPPADPTAAPVVRPADAADDDDIPF